MPVFKYFFPCSHLTHQLVRKTYKVFSFKPDCSLKLLPAQGLLTSPNPERGPGPHLNPPCVTELCSSGWVSAVILGMRIAPASGNTQAISTSKWTHTYTKHLRYWSICYTFSIFFSLSADCFPKLLTVFPEYQFVRSFIFSLFWGLSFLFSQRGVVLLPCCRLAQ